MSGKGEPQDERQQEQKHEQKHEPDRQGGSRRGRRTPIQRVDRTIMKFVLLLGVGCLVITQDLARNTGSGCYFVVGIVAFVAALIGFDCISSQGWDTRS
jgi:hypothetical protein